MLCICVNCSTFNPPAVNKLVVEECHKTITRLHGQMEELHNKFLVQLQNIQEVTNMACVSEVERHRVNHITITYLYCSVITSVCSRISNDTYGI